MIITLKSFLALIAKLLQPLNFLTLSNDQNPGKPRRRPFEQSLFLFMHGDKVTHHEITHSENNPALLPKKSCHTDDVHGGIHSIVLQCLNVLLSNKDGQMYYSLLHAMVNLMQDPTRARILLYLTDKVHVVVVVVSEEVQSRALKGLRTEHGRSDSEPLCLHL